MMIDEITLGGEPAYLRKGTSIALAAGQTGDSIPVGKGEVIDIRAIDLYLEVDDALPLFAFRDKPLLRFILKKELFPGLFLDPHAHRVHQIAGDEDFRRAERSNMNLLEVEGIPTLVSPGNAPGCIWVSARYPLPSVTSFDALAWNLAVTRGTPREAFDYSMDLIYWLQGDESLPPGAAHSLALTGSGHSPADPRHKSLSDPPRIVGYQVAFRANVHYDSQLIERHGAIAGRQSLGTPLLQAFYLIEKLAPLYDIHSLHELVAHASSYQILEPATPFRRMVARMHMPATLTEGESISLEVGDGVKRCEARMDAAVRMRPVEPRPRP